MLTSLKLRMGMLGLAEKMRVIPAGKDMVRSPVILRRQLRTEGNTTMSWQSLKMYFKCSQGSFMLFFFAKIKYLCRFLGQILKKLQ